VVAELLAILALVLVMAVLLEVREAILALVVEAVVVLLLVHQQLMKVALVVVLES
jgi:hypothetical protein